MYGKFIEQPTRLEFVIDVNAAKAARSDDPKQTQASKVPRLCQHSNTVGPAALQVGIEDYNRSD
jgi:hypothetical protein